jgi:hypothetical protein
MHIPCFAQVKALSRLEVFRVKKGLQVFASPSCRETVKNAINKTEEDKWQEQVFLAKRLAKVFDIGLFLNSTR